MPGWKTFLGTPCLLGRANATSTLNCAFDVLAGWKGYLDVKVVDFGWHDDVDVCRSRRDGELGHGGRATAFSSIMARKGRTPETFKMLPA